MMQIHASFVRCLIQSFFMALMTLRPSLYLYPNFDIMELVFIEEKFYSNN